MKTYCLLLLIPALGLATAARAELILHEPFDFPAGISVLGNENGWQRDWNDPGPSTVSLAPRHTQENSPFEEAGLAIQPSNSKDLCFRPLSEPLNGKTVYFSYSMKLFRPDGHALFRVRSTDGYPVNIGASNEVFTAETNANARSTGQTMRAKLSYFIAGSLTLSADGRKVVLSGTAYTDKGAVPAQPPTQWEVTSEIHFGRDRTWQGVQFQIASSAGAFDDLRIATTWAEVTNPNPPASSTAATAPSAPASASPAPAQGGGQPPLPFPAAMASDRMLPEGQFSGAVGEVPQGWRALHPDYLKGIGASIALAEGDSVVFTNADPARTVSLRSEIVIDPAWTGRTLAISAMLYARNLVTGSGPRDDARVALAYERPDGSTVPVDGLALKSSSRGWETLQLDWQVPAGAVRLHVEPGLFQSTGALAVNNLKVTLR